MPALFEAERIHFGDIVLGVIYLLIVLFVIALMIVIPVFASPVFIAQNDPAQFSMTHPAGHCWYFPSVAKEDYSGLYNIPAVNYGAEKYVCELTSAQTASMPEGDYTLVYVYPAKIDTNTIPPTYLEDISWNNSQIVSLFGEVKDEKGKQSYMVMKDLVDMVNRSRLDKMDIYDIAMQPPMLTIKRQEQVGWERIRISGESNLADGTPVKIVVDEYDWNVIPSVDRYYNHSYTTTVHRPYTDRAGNWSYDMMLPIQFMIPGWHTTSVYAGGMQTTARFPIYQAWTPEPTPTQYINYFGNGSMKPDIVTVKIVETRIQYQDRWLTATPTPPITDALGDVVPAANQAVPWEFGVVGLLVLVGIVAGGRK